MRNLAFELGVTDRTIRSDITALTVDHPIETIRGNGGCVKLAEWYHPHRNILSQEHQTVLRQMLDKADEYQNRVLLEILTSFGSGKQLNIADGM